jgi:LacI family transcriptional regulator
LRDAGLQVPEDMSVVGFDELPTDAGAHPFLTVAEQAPYEMGRRAAQLLLARISGQALPIYQEIILPSKVVFRESCRPRPVAPTV